MHRTITLIVIILVTACTPPTPPTTTATAPPTVTVTPTAPPTSTPTPEPTPARPFDIQASVFPIEPGVIFYFRDLEIRLVAPDGSGDRMLITGDRRLSNSHSAPSPSGRYLAISAQQPFLLDLQSGAVTPLSDRTASAIASFYWVGDDILYYVWRGEGGWAIWRYAEGQQQRILLLENRGLPHVLDDQRVILSEATPDGSRQTVVHTWRTGQEVVMDGNYQVVDVAGERVILSEPGDGLGGGMVDGFTLATADWQSGRFTDLTRITQGVYDFDPQLAPDGTMTLVEMPIGEGPITQLLVMRLTAGGPQLTPLTPAPNMACWGGTWYNATQVVAACAEERNAGGALWLLPVDERQAVPLAEPGYPLKP